MTQTAQFIFDYGKIYEPGWPPKDMVRGGVGYFYDVCIMNAICNPKYKYVEGYAENPQKKGMFILHSWLTDGEVAFDPTWQCIKWDVQVPVPAFYVGFEMPTEAVAEFIVQTEYAGVIANSWRNPELAAKCLPAKYPFDGYWDKTIMV